jgi:hypothetical protein
LTERSRDEVCAGAILYFAVNAEVAGLDIDAVGVILMAVGAVGLLLSLFLVESWRRRPGTAAVREERIVRDDTLY